MTPGDKRPRHERLVRFFMQDVWQLPLRNIPRAQYLFFLPLKVLLVALRNFVRDKCSLHASALTFYSLLAIVPAAALGLAVAKGFGFSETLDDMLKRISVPPALHAAQKVTTIKIAPQPTTVPTPPSSKPGEAKDLKANAQKTTQSIEVTILNDVAPGQREAVIWIADMAKEFLATIKGGWLAFAGTVGLFWMVIVLLASIEESFNDIWKVKRGRTIVRKVSDYLSVAIVGPILLVIAGTLTVYVAGEVEQFVRQNSALAVFGGIFFKSIPYLAVWVLFTLLYLIMPNTRVRFKSALVAGIVTGTLYQIVQWTYVAFLIEMPKWNNLFGKLAALPLFLVWLQVSWLIVLLGAEIAFAIGDEETYEPKREFARASQRFRKLLALRIAEVCVKRFEAGEPPATALQLCHQLGAPLPLVQSALNRLEESGILVQVKRNGGLEEYYQPAETVERITIQRVGEALERLGNDSDHIIREGELDRLTAHLEKIDRAAGASPENCSLKDLA